MTITRIKFKNFMAFKDLDIQPSPGINVFIGANGTGKTHLMKAAYAACDITKTQVDFAEKVTSPRPKGRGFMLHRLQPLDKVLRSYAASTCRDDRPAVFNLIPQFTTG